MRCLHPVPTRRGILFPCGKCPACLAQRKEELAQRIFMEARVSASSYFLTLTYDDKHLPFDPETGELSFDKQEVQTYIRSLRDRLRLRDISLRYFFTCEYGDLSERPHYHAVLYFSQFLSLQQVWILCNALWKNRGYVYLSSVGAGCCRYVAKYCLKDDPSGSFELPRDDPRRPFRLFSRRPGIGSTEEVVQYYYEVFQLHKRFFDFDGVNYSGNGERFIPKVPRVVRSKFDEFTQRKCTAVGWSRFYGLQEDLGLALEDPALNCFDPVECTNTPIYDKDLEIQKKNLKLRKLKKHCL